MLQNDTKIKVSENIATLKNCPKTGITVISLPVLLHFYCNLTPYPIRSCSIPVSPSDALAHISGLSGYWLLGCGVFWFR
jgi:hypothetical protein